MVSENAEELRNNAPTGEYEYTHIKDDEEFVTYMKQKAIAFRSPKSFDQQEESFRNLSEIEMSLTELYAYEMLSVDAIESVTDVDSSYISGWSNDLGLLKAIAFCFIYVTNSSSSLI